MSLLVVFVTTHATIIDTIAKKKISLVPYDVRANSFAVLGGEEVVLSGFNVDNRSTVADLLGHFGSLSLPTASGVVLLTDNSLPNLIDLLGNVFSVNQFQPPAYGKDVANTLSAILARCLRAFRHFKTRFNDLKYHQIARLPLRNFDAPEIGEMRAACSNMMNRANFGRELDRALHLLRLRQRPKKASTYRDIYLVDDSKKHFSFGPEVHARADTTCPPHNALCITGNQFRFGCAFDGTKHFNVSRDADARMTGLYPDCHGAGRPGKGSKHLNMFTNDFF